MPASSQEITRVLNELDTGSDDARVRLLEMIYDDLHSLAQGHMRGERVDHTLQPTALLNEAYLRLLGNSPGPWANRAQFFGAAAEVMRRILIDHARRKKADKRGGDRVRNPLDSGIAAASGSPDDILAIDEALTELEAIDPRKARIVKLRFFAGLTLEEIAAGLDVAAITVKRDWRYARAWLGSRIES